MSNQPTPHKDDSKLDEILEYLLLEHSWKYGKGEPEKAKLEAKAKLKALIAKAIQEAIKTELQSLNVSIIGLKTKDQVQEILTSRIAALQAKKETDV